MDDRIYWIWLSEITRGKGALAQQILQQFGDAERFYHAVQAHEAMPTPWAAAAVRRTLGQAEEILEQSVGRGIQVIDLQSPHYPEVLREIYDMPCVLYALGDLTLLGPLLRIAVVGPRDPSEYGIRVANKLSCELAQAGAVVVSGLARGIDTVAHKGALRADGHTIAVVGNGLDVTYPAENRVLQQLIADHGLLLSEYPVGTQPLAGHFPQRNRIISGLCEGTVVVEAGVRSGSLITANLALDQGRDLYAVPGSIFSPDSYGVLKLLQNSMACPVAQASDILEAYRYRFAGKIWPDKIRAVDVDIAADMQRQLDEHRPKTEKSTGATPKKPAPQGLAGDALTIYNVLETSVLGVDEIAARSGLPTARVLAALTELEMLARARAHSGKGYSAC